jgi:hypothetical protein
MRRLAHSLAIFALAGGVLWCSIGNPVGGHADRVRWNQHGWKDNPAGHLAGAEGAPFLETPETLSPTEPTAELFGGVMKPERPLATAVEEKKRSKSTSRVSSDSFPEKIMPIQAFEAWKVHHSVEALHRTILVNESSSWLAMPVLVKLAIFFTTLPRTS